MQGFFSIFIQIRPCSLPSTSFQFINHNSQTVHCYTVSVADSVIKYRANKQTQHNITQLGTLSPPPSLLFKTKLLETGLCLHLQVEPTQLDPTDRVSLCLPRRWRQNPVSNKKCRLRAKHAEERVHKHTHITILII
jgi:hypothetical protein